MPTITRIKPQKNKKRVNIYLDNKFAFGLDLDNLATLNIREGTELTEKEIKKILKKAEFQKTLDKLLRFAALRPRSEKEFNDWLKKHKVHKSLHKELFDKLKRLELLDDEKFAKWWIEQRTNFRPKAKRILNQELRIKGINKNIIEDVLSEVDIDEEKIAKEFLEKKKYKWEKLPRFEARKKMSEFLGRKGFDWSTIKKAAEDYLENTK